MPLKSGKRVLIELKDSVLVIRFSYPKKYNALDREAYVDITNILNEAAQDEKIKIVVFTGAGNYYSSGNDISVGGSTGEEDDIEGILSKSKKILENMIRAFYEFPKLLIALVNGPCIGIAATTAALCDVIYCSDTAYFHTPFTKLGLCAEGGSSYTFPKILGQSKATEMLLLSHKMSADEALKFNFVSAIYTKDEENTKIWPKIMEFGQLPPESLKVTKKLIKKYEKERLEMAVKAELDELHRRWYSNEFFEAMQAFVFRKSKL